MQITTVLTNAAPRTIVPRNGSNPFTVFEVFDHENTAWRVKEDVYNVARYLIGQTVAMVTRTEQNGQWTNRFADIIEAVGGPPLSIPQPAPQQTAPAQALQQAQAAQVAAGRTVPAYSPGSPTLTAPPNPSMPQPAPINTFPTPKDRSIDRQTAAKVAALISGDNPQTFWQNCRDLAYYFDTGVMPQQIVNPGEYAQTAAGS